MSKSLEPQQTTVRDLFLNGETLEKRLTLEWPADQNYPKSLVTMSTVPKNCISPASVKVNVYASTFRNWLDKNSLCGKGSIHI